jgi:hypothetical protein
MRLISGDKACGRLGRCSGDVECDAMMKVRQSVGANMGRLFSTSSTLRALRIANGAGNVDTAFLLVNAATASAFW